MQTKSLVLILLLTANTCMLLAQSDKRIALYNPQADAQAQIDSVVQLAHQNGKHVLLQVGGNWCSWCIRFHQFCQNDPHLDSLIQASYVTLKVNYSKENPNPEVLATLGYPQRFGFPVFVVLDGKGQRLHTQDSGYLEQGGSYDRMKVELFFRNWSPKALNPESYR
ncbi:MAG: thioredoxin family protein [Bacteroidia bacterium]